jgi:predicted DCC family thiol-disulfide oxidoreductase YuxK
MIAFLGADGEQVQVGTADLGKEDWRVLAKKVFETDERPIILYDGVCNLCNGGVNFMLDWDSPNDERGNFRFAALQSDVGRALLQRSGRSPDDCNSIILALKDGNTYAKGEAVLRIGQVRFPP